MLAISTSHLLECFMAIQDIWKENLKALVRAEGGGRSGLRTVASTAHISEEYLYQIVTVEFMNGTTRSYAGNTLRKALAPSIENTCRPAP